MLHHVMRQRRRFAFALLMTQIALFGVWEQTVIFAVMAAGVFAGLILVAASGHFLRRLIECGAIGVLAASRVTDPIWIAAIFVGATALTYGLLYSSILDRLPFRLGMRSKKTFQVATDPQTTWSKLIPGQGHPAAYWTGTMMAARADLHDDATLYITFENGAAPIEEITVTYLNLVPYQRASYLIEKDTLLAGEEVMMTYSLKDAGKNTTTITSDMRVSGLPIRHAVARFFDDVLGDELDSFARMTSFKRTWHLRDTADSALTSEMGQADVKVTRAIPTEPAADRPDQDHSKQNRPKQDRPNQDRPNQNRPNQNRMSA